MKKNIVIGLIIFVLLVAAAGLGMFYVNSLGLFTPEAPTETLPAATEPAPTEPEPTEPESTEPAPTEPEPTEPPFVLETQESWSEFLYGREISAGEYFVYDLDADRFVVRTGSPEDRLYPASITKLYTAYVALQYLDPREQVTVGNEVWLIDEDSSVAELLKEDVLTVEQLVAGMLLPSGNDAAQTIAVTVGRLLAEDPELNMWAAIDRFVEQMNADAPVLGLTGSHFVTVDGMHSYNHYVSMQDMVTIGRLALSNEVIAKCAATETQTVLLREDRSLQWKNTNLLTQEDSRYYCGYITGLKTGFTTPAGYCLLSSAEVNGRNLLIGVFACTYPEDRFADTLLLFMRTLNAPITEPAAPVPEETMPEETMPEETTPVETMPVEPSPTS